MDTVRGPVGHNEQDFSEALRSRRLAAGLTQAALAERAGISTRGVQDIERGLRQPHRETVRRLADALCLGPAEQISFQALATPTPRRRRSPARPIVARLREDGRHPQNLPRQLTTFIGRDREVAEVRSCLEGARLVTLVGVGGIGKTRLALEVAEQVVAQGTFLGGVWLVDLAGLNDAGLVASVVALQLGVGEQPGADPMQAVFEFLRAKDALLILDNCEHLAQACAELAEHLLPLCSGCHILATSREPLGIIGETVWLIPPLTVPEPDPAIDDLLQSEAVRLFIDRARANNRDFSCSQSNAPALAQVCRRLEGIPLALEVAAAGAHVLTVEQIAARLDGHFDLLIGGRRAAPARHRTIQATLDWSYMLLTEPERMLLEYLSVFAGGWTLQATEAVCAQAVADPRLAGSTTSSVLDVLSRLVDKSLVVGDRFGSEMRFRFLEMVRQYASERLNQRGHPSDARRAHAEYFCALLERTEDGLSRQSESAWVDGLRKENDNIRVALRWVIDNREFDWDRAYRMCAQAGALWRQFCAYSEAGVYYEQALEALQHLPDSLDNRRRRVDTIVECGEVSFISDPERSFGRLMEVESVAETLSNMYGADDATRLLRVQVLIGRLLFNRNEFRASLNYYRRALLAGQRLGRPDLTALPAAAIGQTLLMQASSPKPSRFWRKRPRACGPLITGLNGPEPLDFSDSVVPRVARSLPVGQTVNEPWKAQSSQAI